MPAVTIQTPYGRAHKQKRDEPVTVPFTLYNTEQQIKEDTTSGVYRPSVILNSTVNKVRSDISVRITNIPIRITQAELTDAILSKSEMKRPFIKLILVHDRETRISRGFAYAHCEDIEKARELAKTVRNIVIDACVLGAEVIDE